jgi:hypothetical protein
MDPCGVVVVEVAFGQVLSPTISISLISHQFPDSLHIQRYEDAVIWENTEDFKERQIVKNHVSDFMCWNFCPGRAVMTLYSLHIHNKMLLRCCQRVEGSGSEEDAGTT